MFAFVAVAAVQNQISIAVVADYKSSDGFTISALICSNLAVQNVSADESDAPRFLFE